MYIKIIIFRILIIPQFGHLILLVSLLRCFILLKIGNTYFGYSIIRAFVFLTFLLERSGLFFPVSKLLLIRTTV